MNRRGFMRSAIASAIVAPVLGKLGFPIAQAVLTHPATPYTTFAPQIWSNLLVEQFYPATVFDDIANTEYADIEPVSIRCTT